MSLLDVWACPEIHTPVLGAQRGATYTVKCGDGVWEWQCSEEEARELPLGKDSDRGLGVLER